MIQVHSIDTSYIFRKTVGGTASCDIRFPVLISNPEGVPKGKLQTVMLGTLAHKDPYRMLEGVLNNQNHLSLKKE